MENLIKKLNRLYFLLLLIFYIGCATKKNKDVNNHEIKVCFYKLKNAVKKGSFEEVKQISTQDCFNQFRKHYDSTKFEGKYKDSLFPKWNIQGFLRELEKFEKNEEYNKINDTLWYMGYEHKDVKISSANSLGFIKINNQWYVCDYRQGK